MSKIATLKTVYFFRGDIVPFLVETTIAPGIGIHCVGIPDAAVKETLLRVITAIQALGYHCPGKKIIINIKPLCGEKKFSGAFRPKECSQAFDLAIAISILIASEQIQACEGIADVIFFAQLGLDGALLPPFTGIDSDSAASVLSWQLRRDCTTIIGYPATFTKRCIYEADKYKNLYDVIESMKEGKL